MAKIRPSVTFEDTAEYQGLILGIRKRLHLRTGLAKYQLSIFQDVPVEVETHYFDFNSDTMLSGLGTWIPKHFDYINQSHVKGLIATIKGLVASVDKQKP